LWVRAVITIRLSTCVQSRTMIWNQIRCTSASHVAMRFVQMRNAIVTLSDPSGYLTN